MIDFETNIKIIGEFLNVPDVFSHEGNTSLHNFFTKPMANILENIHHIFQYNPNWKSRNNFMLRPIDVFFLNTDLHCHALKIVLTLLSQTLNDRDFYEVMEWNKDTDKSVLHYLLSNPNLNKEMLDTLLDLNYNIDDSSIYTYTMCLCSNENALTPELLSYVLNMFGEKGKLSYKLNQHLHTYFALPRSYNNLELNSFHILVSNPCFTQHPHLYYSFIDEIIEFIDINETSTYMPFSVLHYILIYNYLTPELIYKCMEWGGKWTSTLKNSKCLTTYQCFFTNYWIDFSLIELMLAYYEKPNDPDHCILFLLCKNPCMNSSIFQYIHKHFEFLLHYKDIHNSNVFHILFTNTNVNMQLLNYIIQQPELQQMLLDNNHENVKAIDMLFQIPMFSVDHIMLLKNTSLIENELIQNLIAKHSTKVTNPTKINHIINCFPKNAKALNLLLYILTSSRNLKKTHLKRLLYLGANPHYFNPFDNHLTVIHQIAKTHELHVNYYKTLCYYDADLTKKCIYGKESIHYLCQNPYLSLKLLKYIRNYSNINFNAVDFSKCNILHYYACNRNFNRKIFNFLHSQMSSEILKLFSLGQYHWSFYFDKNDAISEKDKRKLLTKRIIDFDKNKFNNRVNNTSICSICRNNILNKECIYICKNGHVVHDQLYNNQSDCLGINGSNVKIKNCPECRQTNMHLYYYFT